LQKLKTKIMKNKLLFTLFILLSLSSLSIANPTLTLKSVREITFQINHDYVYPIDPCGNVLTVTVQCSPNSACSVEGNMQQAADDYKAAHTGPNGCYF